MFGGRSRLLGDLHGVDARELGSSPAPGDRLLHVVVVPLELGLDRAVGPVRDPAVELEAAGDLAERRPEEHALHPASHDDPHVTHAGDATGGVGR